MKQHVGVPYFVSPVAAAQEVESRGSPKMLTMNVCRLLSSLEEHSPPPDRQTGLAAVLEVEFDQNQRKWATCRDHELEQLDLECSERQ